jgi:ADP-heptose:LPS heptosyltransferase
MKAWAVKYFASIGIKKRPIVLLSPISSMPSKDLDISQINEVISGVRQLGFNILISHKTPIEGVDCPVASGLGMKEWLACIDQANYVISVDTGTFHAANGLNKPTVGIFTWADGKIYGKYHPKSILVQIHRDEREWCGPCFNWTTCIKCPQTQLRKPCVTEITGKMVCDAFVKLIDKYPKD